MLAATLFPRVFRAKTLQGEPSNQVTELLIRWRGGDRVAPVVEWKFRGVQSVNGTAEVLAISPSIFEHRWMSARTCLFRELDRSAVQ